MPLNFTVDPRYSTRVVDKYPACSWMPTGVNVNAGQTLCFKAEGKCTGMMGSTLGAGGSWHIGNPKNLAPNAPGLSLVGKIGESTPFFIGEFYCKPAHAAGLLYLGYNDTRADDNAGRFTVTLSFERPPPLSMTGFWDIYVENQGWSSWQFTPIKNYEYQFQQLIYGVVNENSTTGTATAAAYQLTVSWVNKRQKRAGRFFYALNATWTAGRGWYIVDTYPGTGSWNSTITKRKTV